MATLIASAVLNHENEFGLVLVGNWSIIRFPATNYSKAKYFQQSYTESSSFVVSKNLFFDTTNEF